MTAKAPTLWLAPHKENPEAKLRLFCFPYAGGGTLIFRDWARNLLDTVELCPVQLPGRDRRAREEPITNISSLVQAMAGGLSSWLDLPFAFFGHSMGALIGFELAHYLREKYGREPVHLFVSARPAPQIPDPDEPTYNLSEAEFIDELRRLNGTPREVIDNKELMTLMVPLIRADFELCQTYAYLPKPPLNCLITAMGGLRDKSVTRQHLEAWQVHTTSSFSLRMFPGDHFFLHSYEATLLQIISRELHRLVE